MNATLFAVVLSLCVVSHPLFATSAKGDIAPVSGAVLKKINLNTADVKLLTGSFQRIGKLRAQAIVKYRQAHGGFKSVAQLAEVHGLGQAFVSQHLAELQGVFVVE